VPGPLCRGVARRKLHPPMTDLPTGTVTFLFSDIEGSTQLARALGGGWPDQLERHRQILRQAFASAGGVEVGTEGDSFFAVFPSAAGAIAAAAEAQRGLAAEDWPADPLRVRIGVHTGEAEVRDGTYVGLQVHRASRIADAGNGGQVLLSETTRPLVAADLPDGVALRDLGPHRLKDLPEPEVLSELVIPGVTGDPRRLRTLETPTNLPSKLTTFLGREGEIQEIASLLGSTRLLTLSGPGGTGKTRLSIQVAARLIDRYPDGVYFVDLSSITQPEIVASTIAQELGLPDRGGRDPMERLADHLRDRRVLLVLDNFEQVLDAAPVVADLLAGAPGLAVLVTSRSALHVYGEREYPVPPLKVPDPKNLPPLAALTQYEAVALFIERATAVLPGFHVTNENAPALAEICVRLDGLPLAIELAAARIRVLNPQAILARLEHRLGLLSSGARDLPARQQTLRGAIAWSYDLLDEAERTLFSCMSIFVGGAALEMVEGLCAARVDADLFDTLASLVDKSLVRQEETSGGVPRYHMLETIREFAVERLEDSGGAAELREQHANLFRGFAERARPELMGSDSGRWLDAVELEHGNLRASIAWALEHDAETALRLVTALWRFWQRRGYLVEGLERARAAIALPDAAEHDDRIGPALEAVGGLAYWIGDHKTSTEMYERSLELARRHGDRAAEADALYNLSFTYYYSPDQSGELAETARRTTEQALELYRELGNRHGEALALWALANTWFGMFSEPIQTHARDLGAQALAIFEEEGDAFMVGWATYMIALTHLADREPDRALPRLRDALRVFVDANDMSGYTIVFDALAITLLEKGDRLAAARLAGAVAALERATGTGLNPRNRQVLGIDTATLRDDPDTAEAWARGESAPLDDLVREALEL
jgi:predicted ATPase/class 3 adenylate cyclase